VWGFLYPPLFTDRGQIRYDEYTSGVLYYAKFLHDLRILSPTLAKKLAKQWYLPNFQVLGAPVLTTFPNHGQIWQRILSPTPMVYYIMSNFTMIKAVLKIH